jgi:hypothetical protein
LIYQSLELSYHFTLWSTYYVGLMEYLVELESFGNGLTLQSGAFADRFGGAEADIQSDDLTGNWLVGSKEDTDVIGYMMSQFQWGKTAISFYRHPLDDNKCVVATKNILGR